MADARDTAYPVLREDIGPKELADRYRPTEEELLWAKENTQSPKRRAALTILLKVAQNIGQFPLLSEIPASILRFVSHEAGYVGTLGPDFFASYDGRSNRPAMTKLLRARLRIRPLDDDGWRWITAAAESACESMYRTEDIINSLVERLVQQSYEFPAFSRLDAIAKQARLAVNDRYLNSLAEQLTDKAKLQIEQLFDTRQAASITHWHALKREPKKPTSNETRDFLKHVQWLIALVDLMPPLNIPVPKLKYLQDWAHKADASDMKRMPEKRRHGLSVVLLKSVLSKAFDDVGTLFVRMLANLETNARRKLLAQQIEQQQESESLVEQLRDLLEAYQLDGSATSRVDAIDGTLTDDPEKLIARCNDVLMHARGNFFPFMVAPYLHMRSQLFKSLEIIDLRSPLEDKSTERWIDILGRLQHVRLPVVLLETYDIDPKKDLVWVPLQLRELVLIKPPPRRPTIEADRRYLEIAIFRQIQIELRAGDLSIRYSDEFRDWRDQLVTEDEYAEELKSYKEIAGVETDGSALCEMLKRELTELTLAVDQRMPDNEDLAIVNGRPSVRRLKKKEKPKGFAALDRALGERLPETSIVNVFSDVTSWCKLDQFVQPISGQKSRIEDRHSRFVLTTLCYGCNLGPTQTSRSVKNWSRKEVAWLNAKHLTEDLIKRSATEVINAYNRFDLQRFFGSEKAVSVDGTKFDLYEQNIFSQFHIRYGGYGGIGYYVVSGTYVALFARFNTCGAHESNYMLDWLMENKSDVHPDVVHGDTHSQNYAAYSLAYLLGVQLMPRIKGFGEYQFYLPSRGLKLKNIGSIFTQTIDWEIIEKGLPEMLKIIFSLKRGKLSASTALRRIGTHSRKNKLYTAFRELGAVIRTMFLLRYIDDKPLRHTIFAATNKSEEFNSFLKWVFFGVEGTIQENVRGEQQKLVKYGMLAANMVMLHNLDQMTVVIEQLRREGMEITAEMLAGLSPYRFAHINRLGTYDVDDFRPPAAMRTGLGGILPADRSQIYPKRPASSVVGTPPQSDGS